MNKPIISVIVTAYNIEKYIKQCLESINLQTYKDFECIIVNDGSSDDTQKIIDEFIKDKHHFKSMYKTNEGVSTARNAGFESSTGEYVIFLDGDDFFDEHLLEFLYRKIVESSSDMTFCNYKVFYESMQKFSEPQIDYTLLSNSNFISYHTDPENILNTPTLMVWNKIFKSSFLRDNKLKSNKRLQRAQDIDFVGRAILNAEKIGIVEAVLVSYRSDTGVSNVSKLYRHPYDVVRALNYLRKYIDSKKIYKLVKISYIKVSINHLLANLYFTETYQVHKLIFNKAKKLLLETGLDELRSTHFSDERLYEAGKKLVNSSYEEWLRFRITDLRDDSEAKFISYLLEKTQHEYEDMKQRYEQEHALYYQIKELNQQMEESASWKVTKPLRSVKRIIDKRPHLPS